MRRSPSSPAPRTGRPRRPGRPLAAALLLVVLAGGGCAKYNTYFNAKRHFDEAEHVRQEAIRKHEDLDTPTGNQKTDYEKAIHKSQKILDEYPGHSLTDDALFLQAKAYHRLESYRMSIRKFDLLFTNFPATPYLEEALYLQALNYLLIGNLDRSQGILDRLTRQYPESSYQAESRKVSGDNAYSLQDWETAARSYQSYLDAAPRAEDRDRVGLKLAECCWELRDYAQAAAVLTALEGKVASPELAFRAALLKARVHVRLGDFATVADLVPRLRQEAPLYKAEGEAVLVEAESLVAQGRGGDAAPLIEGMPEEWENPDVKARSADILGYHYLEQGKLEEARPQFQAALRRRDVLQDEIRSRLLDDHLQAYLSAERALPDAKGSARGRLKLLQANSMLFGFDRPALAADLYREAAADSAAEASVAARALYGALITYRDHLDDPDSAAIFGRLLQQEHPDSPQAFELRRPGEGDLLAYLLDQQRLQQEAALAALSPEERAALEAVPESGPADSFAASGGGSGFRRRMIYFGHRQNLVFPTPELAIRMAAARAVRAGDEEPEAWFGAPAPTSIQGSPPPATGQPGREPAEKEEKETKPQKPKGFDLRAPRPGERP